MAKWIPFTLHVKIVPDHGSGSTDAKLKSKRFEYIRDMQKISSLMYSAIDSITGLQVAQPGGGQHRSLYGGDHNNSGLTNGAAVKPQIGESPAQIMLTGFMSTSATNSIQYHSAIKRISGNEIYEGNVASPAELNPLSALDTLVSTLKTNVVNAFISDLPSGIIYDVFRIEMAGVTYGDRGYHFP
jgi:hypothetical protein